MTKALLREYLINTSLLWGGLIFNFEIQIYQEISAYIFNFLIITLNCDLPKRINTLQHSKIINNNSVLFLNFQELIFLVHDQEQPLKATESLNVHLLDIEVAWITEYLLKNFTSHFVIQKESSLFWFGIFVFFSNQLE